MEEGSRFEGRRWSLCSPDLSGIGGGVNGMGAEAERIESKSCGRRIPRFDKQKRQRNSVSTTGSVRIAMSHSLAPATDRIVVAAILVHGRQPPMRPVLLSLEAERKQRSSQTRPISVDLQQFRICRRTSYHGALRTMAPDLEPMTAHHLDQRLDLPRPRATLVGRDVHQTTARPFCGDGGLA